MGELGLKVNRVLRRIFGYRRNKVRECLKKLNDEELSNLCT
jgi:hypothetical protein